MKLIVQHSFIQESDQKYLRSGFNKDLANKFLYEMITLKDPESFLKFGSPSNMVST